MRPIRDCPVCSPDDDAGDANGSPAAPERKLVDELPSWCRAVRFDAATRTVTLTIALPTRDAFGRTIEQLVALEADEQGARAIAAAFGAMAAKFSAPPRVIDVG